MKSYLTITVLMAGYLGGLKFSVWTMDQAAKHGDSMLALRDQLTEHFSLALSCAVLAFTFWLFSLVALERE